MKFFQRLFNSKTCLILKHHSEIWACLWTNLLNSEKQEHQKFRKWMSDLNEISSPIEAQRFYSESNASPRGFFETFWGKSTKSVTMMMIGAYAGSFADTKIGTMLGLFGGLVANNATGYILDMADEYLLSELTKGWHLNYLFQSLNHLTISIHYKNLRQVRIYQLPSHLIKVSFIKSSICPFYPASDALGTGPPGHCVWLDHADHNGEHGRCAGLSHQTARWQSPQWLRFSGI